ncbi:M16 family metallopeptidase [Paludibacterium purpuratum]|uniref:Zinc protease n=1 Tax=Paludibacterium purpuratum TaxID=1144873 RepID=A0A4R7BD73_9NEIS|nr:pitrilysin family protein [Paludibacterium purpuratum]TDR82122.1 zinc protease [Paludibacterium purpuratum]
MRLKTLGLLLALSFAPSLPAFADAVSPAIGTPYSSVEGISEYRLANGLRVLLAPDDSKPTTTVNVTYLVGSRHEGYGEAGMAHLLEHMLFKGTPTSDNLATELSRRGMQFNGSTFFDRTNYYETFPANADSLHWAIAMEADRMVHSKIAKSDLDTEFSVVRNEMEMGENNPYQVLWTQLSAISFDWHNYGRQTIGARSDVEKVRIENLQAFYRKYYQPDNAVLIVSGKFDPASTLTLIERQFGQIPRPARALAPTWTEEPPRDGEREVTVRRVGDSKLIAALYHISAGSHADYPALVALSLVLADTPNGRLYRALVQGKKAVGISYMPLGLAEPGYMMFGAELSKNQPVVPAREVLLQVLENLRRHPVTEQELTRAKVALLKSFEQTLNDPQELAVQMSEAIAQGDWRLYFITRDRIEKLSSADLMRVAESYLKPANRSFGQFLPAAKPSRVVIPAPPDVAKLTAGYQGRAPVAQGEAFDSRPANIGARTHKSQLGNGAQLALLPKKTRGETVHGSFSFSFGDEQNLRGQETAAKLAGQMLLRGSRMHSRAQIADKLDALKASLSIEPDGQSINVSFKTVRGNLALLLALIGELLQHPANPVSEFEQLKKEMLTSLDNQRSEPLALASQALSQLLNRYAKDDFRYAPTQEESARRIKSARLQDLKRFQQTFYGADHAQLALVGDFDATSVKQQLAQLFGRWNSQARYQRLPSLPTAPHPASIEIKTPDKANASYLAQLPLAVRDNAADYPALLAANHILGVGGNSRLILRLRQQDGLSYGVGSRVVASSFESVGQFVIDGIFAPGNLPRFQQGLAEELARLLKDGVSEQELDAAKHALSQGVQVALAQDNVLATWLDRQLETGRSMAFTAKRLDDIAKLTVADVNAALRKYIDPAKLSQAYAGAFQIRASTGALR